MRNFFIKRALLVALLLSSTVALVAQQLRVLPKENLNFMVSSDMGRRGSSEQRDVAKVMAAEASANNIAFLLVAGDPIHDNGVQSVKDSEWMVKIENIYPESLKQIPWYVVPGNHEYRGKVNAVIEYSKTHPYWNMPSRYYSIEKEIDGEKVLFVMIDTTPLIDSYRRGLGSSDAGEQDVDAEIGWIKKTLAASDARWKFVVGHHPVFAGTTKSMHEREDMQAKLKDIIEGAGVDFYIGGHIHNFQYIRPEGTKVNYIVNSAASPSRAVEPLENTVFSSGDPGFTVFTVSNNIAQFFFVNDKGETIYTKTITK